MKHLVHGLTFLPPVAMSFSVIISIAQAVTIDPRALGVSAVVQLIGWPTVMAVLWRMSKTLKTLNEFMLMYRIEHEIIMEEWEERTKQTRPSKALANAKKAGM